mmetsp:Transcript_420/g.911  ORF Transcript_420/g.911 Transcript_420/m.911 type:complete len:667 (-) Transcript_420:98-2098(-)
MAIFSDSDFSAAHESIDDDDDFNMSDHESDHESNEEEDDLDLENEKTKAVREGFSLHRSVDSTPGGKDNMDEWLSTQPASAAKNRRVSPRRSSNKPKGITGAIVGAIKGDTDSLVIPKKKKATPKQQEAVVPTTTTNQAKSQQPPMKKRKVSLSPTDSLAKKRTSLSLEVDEAKRKQVVINLLLDDDSDDSDDEILAIKRDRMTKPEIAPPRLTPSILEAASKQQKEHVQANKQKKSEKNNSTLKPSENKPLSKVSGVTYAEQPIAEKPTETPPVTLQVETSKTKQTKRKARSLPTSATNTNNSNTKNDGPSKTVIKAKNKSIETNGETSKTDVPAKTSKTKESKAKKGNSKDDAPAKSSIENKSEEKILSAPTKTMSEAKSTKNAQTKTSQKDAEVSAKATKATPKASKPPLKKKKKCITFEDELLQKMFMTCRPYSVRDLVQLMGKTTSEASINFCLLGLIDKKWIIKKEFKSGKRSKELYWANQISKDKKLWALECLQLPTSDKIKETRLELATLQQKQKSLAKEIADVEKTPSNKQLSGLCETAQQQVDELSKKLDAVKQRIHSSTNGKTKTKTKTKPLQQQPRRNFKQNPKKAMTGITPLGLKKRINAMRDHWVKRKRKCMDFCDQLADGMEKKVKDVVHKVLELETDEAENAVLPPKHVV